MFADISDEEVKHIIPMIDKTPIQPTYDFGVRKSAAERCSDQTPVCTGEVFITLLTLIT